MSINHISSETFWWTKKQQSSIPNMFEFNLNNNMSNNTHNEDDDELGQSEDKLEEIPRDHLFEKPLTPSDVGKLNRLVIPKQHAEKYFPLSGNNNNNTNNNDGGTEKGLLLSFEDESGKSWRFRYSYWNSSQSYVLTKGWSRFVKEKKLDAGDVVLFERHRVDGDRQFIGWRRKNGAAVAAAAATTVAPPGGGGGWGQVHPFPSAGVPYQTDFLHAGRGVMHNQLTTPNGNNTRRQVRLFGVNLECEVDDSSSWSESSTPDGSISSNHHQQNQEYYQSQAGQHYYQYQVHYSNPHANPPASSYNNNHHYNTDMDHSRDVNQMRYHQG